MSLTLVSLALSVSLSFSLVLLSSTLIPPVSVSLLLPLIFFPRHALHINFSVSFSDSLQRSCTLCLCVCVWMCVCVCVRALTSTSLHQISKDFDFQSYLIGVRRRSVHMSLTLRNESKTQNKSFLFCLNALIQLSISVRVCFLCLQYECMCFSDQQWNMEIQEDICVFDFTRECLCF